MLLEEVENHVASLANVGGIHGHFAEEIPHLRIYHGQRAQAVP